MAMVGHCESPAMIIWRHTGFDWLWIPYRTVYPPLYSTVRLVVPDFLPFRSGRCGPSCQLEAPFGPNPTEMLTEEPEQCLKVMPVGNCGAGNLIKPCGTRNCVPYRCFSTHSAVLLGSTGVVLSKLPVGGTFWSTPQKP